MPKTRTTTFPSNTNSAKTQTERPAVKRADSAPQVTEGSKPKFFNSGYTSLVEDARRPSFARTNSTPMKTETEPDEDDVVAVESDVELSPAGDASYWESKREKKKGFYAASVGGGGGSIQARASLRTMSDGGSEGKGKEKEKPKARKGSFVTGTASDEDEDSE